jgi:hypothetical protein
MAVVTGTSGELRYNGVRVGKCRSFSLDINRDALESTVLGTWDRTYVEGLRGASGNATVLYDKDDTSTVQLLNSVFSNTTGAQTIGFVLNTSLNTVFEVSAILTQVTAPVSVGEVIACSLTFQVTGPISGTF